LLALEKKIKETLENLKDWQENAEAKISGPEAAIAATIERLRMVRLQKYIFYLSAFKCECVIILYTYFGNI